MNGGQRLANCLKDLGVRAVYGVPGEENADFLFGLKNAGIEFRMTRHEQGAGFIAAGIGRMTGRPGVCLSTLGPGASNLLTAIADADMDRMPVIAIVGQAGADRRHRDSHQVIDLVRLFEPVCKWVVEVRDPATIPGIVAKAYRLAVAERPGAVVIILPEDVAGQTCKGHQLQLSAAHSPDHSRALGRSLGPAAADGLTEAADLLAAADRPLIVAGNAVIRTGATQAVRAFAGRFGMGVVSTFMAKGLLPIEAQNNLFTIGLGQRDHIVDAVKEADLLLSIGMDLTEYPPELWSGLNGGKLIHIDAHPAAIERAYLPNLDLVGDIAQTLTALSDQLAAGQAPDYDFSVQREVRNRILSDLHQVHHPDPQAEGPIHPVTALTAVRDALDPGDLLVTGVGAHKMWVGRHYHSDQPNRVWLPNGYCAMGAGLGLAIGGDIALPNQRVLALLGDGDILMNVQELETAKRLGSNLTVLVWEDHAYGLIEWKQRDHHGEALDHSFVNPDWAHLALAFGWSHRAVSSPAALAQALSAAVQESGPSLVVMPVDYRANARLSAQLGTIEVSCG